MRHMGNKAVWGLSLGCGACFGVIFGLCGAAMGWSQPLLTGLLAGLVFVAVLVPVLACAMACAERRYAAVERNIPERIQFRCDCLLRGNPRTIAARLYVTCGGVYLAADHTRKMQKLFCFPRKSLGKCCAKDGTLLLYSKAGEMCLCVCTPQADALCEAIAGMLEADSGDENAVVKN